MRSRKESIQTIIQVKKAQKTKQRAPAAVVGASVDPSVILSVWVNPFEVNTRWMNFLSFKSMRLLICDLVEAFALPLYREERPNNSYTINTIKSAIAIGREWAETQVPDDSHRNGVLEDLRVFAGLEEEFSGRLPDGRYMNDSAYNCLKAADCCLLPFESIEGTHMWIRQATERYYQRTQKILLSSPEMKYLMAPWDGSVRDVAKQQIRENFQEAEAEASEGGYPVLVPGKNAYFDAPEFVLGTLARHNMIQRMNEVQATNPSDAIQEKLSLAYSAMQAVDKYAVYLLNIDRPVRFWKGDENMYQMSAWQVLLNNAKTRPVERIVLALRSAPRLR